MDNQTKHECIYKGSIIKINRLKILLDEQNISYIIKDHANIGLTTGFATFSENLIEVWILQTAWEEALKCVKIIENQFD